MPKRKKKLSVFSKILRKKNSESKDDLRRNRAQDSSCRMLLGHSGRLLYRILEGTILILLRPRNTTGAKMLPKVRFAIGISVAAVTAISIKGKRLDSRLRFEKKVAVLDASDSSTGDDWHFGI